MQIILRTVLVTSQFYSGRPKDLMVTGKAINKTVKELEEKVN